MSPLDCVCRWNAPTLLNKPSAFDIFHIMLFLWVLSLLFTITHCEAKLFSRSFHKLSSLAFIFFLNSPPTTPLTIYEWIFQTNMYVFFANRYCGRMINGLFLRSGILFTNVQVLRSRDNFTHFLHIWIFSFFFVSNDDSQFTNKFLLQISIAAICFAQMKLFDKLHFEFTIYSCLYLYLYFFSSFHSHQSLTLRHL